MRKLLLFSAILLVSAGSIAWAHNLGKGYRRHKANAETFPSLHFLSIDSTTVLNTSGVLFGKSTLFIYYSPDCEHCQQLVEGVKENMRLLANTNIYLISPMPIEELKAFYATFHLYNYKNITEGMDFKYEFFNYFQTISFPSVSIYDTKKRLVKLFRQPVKIEDILAAIHSIQP